MSKQETKTGVDEGWAAFSARVSTDIIDRRPGEASDHTAVARKIESVQAHLQPNVAQFVVEDWRLEGWEIEPDPAAPSTWPITAHLVFRHRSASGHDAAELWAESGSEACLEWLEESGFPEGEVNFVME